MRKFGRLSLTLAIVLLSSSTLRAGQAFPVEPFPYPHRSVAASLDFNAIRYNPSSLGLGQGVEFAWHHKFSGDPTGFNSIAMRAKNFGVSVSWLDDRVYGKRREYFLAAGKSVSRYATLGASLRWLKADDSLLQNKTTFNFGTTITPAPAWTAGIRWENAFHTSVGGVATDGLWVLGVRSQPVGPKAEFTLDWYYPGWATLSDTDFRLAVKYRPTLGVNLRGYVDTEERIGLELEFVVERSKGGAEVRWQDLSEYSDGTLYLTVLNEEYSDARRRSRQ